MRLLHVSLMIFEPPPFFVIIAMAVVAVTIAIGSLSTPIKNGTNNVY